MSTPRSGPAWRRGGGVPGDVDLVYEVDAGTAYTVADTEIAGLRSTSRRWATNVAEMESGAPLREDEVAAARSRLYETGLFTMVRSDSFLTEGGQTEIVFDVEERPRFSTAYGLRWDSDEGTQAVVDVVDQNFLGRSVTLGFGRSTKGRLERSARGRSAEAFRQPSGAGVCSLLPGTVRGSIKTTSFPLCSMSRSSKRAFKLRTRSASTSRVAFTDVTV